LALRAAGARIAAGQQTGPGASRFSEGPVDDSDYDDESDSDTAESDSDTAESAPPAPEATRAKKQHGETEKPKESRESFCLFGVLPVVFLLILCACWMYLVAKSGLRLGLAVYDV
jgi:hypothetical protein